MADARSLEDHRRSERARPRRRPGRAPTTSTVRRAPVTRRAATGPRRSAAPSRPSPRPRRRARPRSGPARPGRRRGGGPRPRTPPRGGSGARTASRRPGSRTGTTRRPGNRRRCAGSAPPSSPRARAPRSSAASFGGRGDRLSDRQLGGDARVVRVGLGPSNPSIPWARAQPARTAVRRLDRGHPVDRRPAAEAAPRPGSKPRRPSGGQAVVQVEPVERVELGAGHRRLGQERPRLEDDDRPAGLGQRLSHDAAAGPRANDRDVGLEDDRRGAVGGTGRREVKWRDRSSAPPSAPGSSRRSRSSASVRVPGRPSPGIGVGEEAEQPAERLVGRPPERQPRPAPARRGTARGPRVEVG